MTQPVGRAWGGQNNTRAMATAQEALAVASSAAAQTTAVVRMASGEISTSRLDRQSLWSTVKTQAARIQALEEALALLGSEAGSDSVAAVLTLVNNLAVRMDVLEREPGPAGVDGKSVELMAGADGVLWRQDDGMWQQLFGWDDVRGPAGADGKPVEVGVNAGAIAWRYVGSGWRTLVQLADLAGAVGPAGADGAVGPVGPAGVDGAAGPAGPAGADGPAGPKGLTGAAGADGVAGPAGPAGADGVAGPVGATGAKGETGAVGPVGPAGADVAHHRVGIGIVPSLKMGGSVDVTVTWDAPMPSSTYEIRVARGELASSGTVTLKSQTSAAAVFTVKSTLTAVTPGTVFAAIAVA